MSKDALSGPGVATASAPDPEHRPHSTRGALVQNGLDRAQGGVEHHPLAGVALVGWAGVNAEEGWSWGLSELTVLAHRSFNHRFLSPDRVPGSLGPWLAARRLTALPGQR